LGKITKKNNNFAKLGEKTGLKDLAKICKIS